MPPASTAATAMIAIQLQSRCLATRICGAGGRERLAEAEDRRVSGVLVELTASVFPETRTVLDERLLPPPCGVLMLMWPRRSNGWIRDKFLWWDRAGSPP